MKAKVSDAFSFMVVIETEHGKSHLKCNDPQEAKEIVKVINAYDDLRGKIGCASRLLAFKEDEDVRMAYDVLIGAYIKFEK